MAKITRRGFLTMAGTGVAGVALAKVGMGYGGFGSEVSGASIQFVAVGPLPPEKVSPIATMVLRGYASPDGSGQITTQVYPGYPAISNQALSKMTEVGRVEGLRAGTPLRLTGRLDNVANPAVPRSTRSSSRKP